MRKNIEEKINLCFWIKRMDIQIILFKAVKFLTKN